MTVPDSPAGLDELRGRGMTERSAGDRRRVPWEVQLVGGSRTEDPFAYTRGLWQAFGHPEIWATPRPVAGNEDDPGWMLSGSDLGEVLNSFGERVRAGEHFSAGSSSELVVDGGRTTLQLAFDDAAPDWPAAHQVHPQASVLRLSYVLARQAVRDYAPPVPDAVERLRPRAEAVLAAAHGAPTAFAIAGDEGLGPYAQVIEALCALLDAADEDDLMVLASAATAAAPWQQGALGAVAEEARVSRRTGQLDAVQERAAQACRRAVGRIDPGGDEHARESLRRGLLDALVGAAGAWVVADLLDEEQFHAAAGLLTGTLVGGDEDEEVARTAGLLAERLGASTDKERRRLVRALDRDPHSRVRRVLVLQQQALATGAAALWRTVVPDDPAGDVDDDEADLLLESYEGAVAALVLGDRAPSVERDAALNPFRLAFKLRELG